MNELTKLVKVIREMCEEERGIKAFLADEKRGKTEDLERISRGDAGCAAHFEQFCFKPDYT